MTATRPADEVGLVRMFRRILISLALVGMIGTAAELAMLRHWNSRDQLIPWFALGALLLALVLIVGSGTRSAIGIARVLAALVALAAIYGVISHVQANYEAGPLDFRYADSWSNLSATSRWWAAATGGVGPSPALAPLILAQSAACLWLATLRHPGRRAHGGGEAGRPPPGAREIADDRAMLR
jgi:hypothetical protein